MKLGKKNQKGNPNKFIITLVKKTIPFRPLTLHSLQPMDTNKKEKHNMSNDFKLK